MYLFDRDFFSSIVCYALLAVFDESHQTDLVCDIHTHIPTTTLLNGRPQMRAISDRERERKMSARVGWFDNNSENVKNRLAACHFICTFIEHVFDAEKPLTHLA